MTNTDRPGIARCPPGLTGPEATVLNDAEDFDPLAEPLPGSVCEQFIRCGRPGCHCRTGNRHGPYYYRVWRGAGRTIHKIYVKRADVAQVRRQCESHLVLSVELRAAVVRARVLRVRLEGQIRRFHILRQRRMDWDEKQRTGNRKQCPGCKPEAHLQCSGVDGTPARPPLSSGT